MDWKVFHQRFKDALFDFVHERRVKDELAAYASATQYGLFFNQDRLPSKLVVHQLMLAAAYPFMEEDCIENAYRSVLPWWQRNFWKRPAYSLVAG